MLNKQSEAVSTSSNPEGGRLQKLLQGATRVAVLMAVITGTAYQALTNTDQYREARKMSDPDSRKQIIKKANEYCRQACTEAGVDFESIGFTEKVVERLYLEAVSATEEGLETVRRQKNDPYLSLPPLARNSQEEIHLKNLISEWVEHRSEKSE